MPWTWKGSAANHLKLPLIVIVELRKGTVLDDSAILPYLFPRIRRLLTKLRIGDCRSIALGEEPITDFCESTSLIAPKESVFV